MIVERNAARAFAALNAANEAILYAESPAALYQQVCDAAFCSGDFLATAIFLQQPGAEMLRFAAGAGELSGRLKDICISVAETPSRILGLAGEAFRDQRPSTSNDFVNDARSWAWRELARELHVGAVTALPLCCGSRSVGVLIVYLRETETLDGEAVSLLLRMAANVSFALNNFEREENRRITELAVERISRMYVALSSTNEAIMRASSRKELCKMVCKAAARGGRFTSTSIGLAQSGTDFLEIVASAGPTSKTTKNARLSTNENDPEGRGICGEAFRSMRPCISNDYLADARGELFHAKALRDGVRAAAAFPLLRCGQAIGILLFISAEQDMFTPEFVDLLRRLADNVSFALRNFDLADQKNEADKQEGRLTRMFAALSATNEAIMRAKSRTELFELACEAAVLGGPFTSATIAMASPDEHFLRIAASNGPDQ